MTQFCSRLSSSWHIATWVNVCKSPVTIQFQLKEFYQISCWKSDWATGWCLQKCLVSGRGKRVTSSLKRRSETHTRYFPGRHGDGNMKLHSHHLVPWFRSYISTSTHNTHPNGLHMDNYRLIPLLDVYSMPPTKFNFGSSQCNFLSNLNNSQLMVRRMYAAREYNSVHLQCFQSLLVQHNRNERSGQSLSVTSFITIYVPDSLCP